MDQITVFQQAYNMRSAPKHVRAELRRLLRKHGGNVETNNDFDALQVHDAVRHKAKDLATRFGLPA